VAEKSNAGKASAGASDSAASGPGHSDESFQREITTRMQSFFEAARLQPIFDAQQRMLTDVVSSPLAPKVAALIRKRLGRDLE